jgi:hypothetical protein
VAPGWAGLGAAERARHALVRVGREPCAAGAAIGQRVILRRLWYQLLWAIGYFNPFNTTLFSPNE